MLTRKFGNRGPYIYNGKQIDSYELATWIGKYNRENNEDLRPSTVTEDHIILFLKRDKAICVSKRFPKLRL